MVISGRCFFLEIAFGMFVALKTGICKYRNFRIWFSTDLHKFFD